MDPLTTIAVALGIKAGSNAIDALTGWLGSGRQVESLHMSSDGATQFYSGGVPANLHYVPLVEVEIDFVTTDPNLAGFLDSENPCLFVVAAPDPNGEPIIDAMPCSVTDSLIVDLPAGEISVAMLVFHEELVDDEGDPLLVAWQIVEAEVYDHAQMSIDLQFDPDFIRLLDLVAGVPVCDECWLEDDVVSSSWRVTRRGNLKCNVCGTNNDFHECVRCESNQFRPTRKGNFRCLNCDTKVVA